MAGKGDCDTLEKTIRFLQKREGIDKTLKIIRYTSRLIAAVSPPGSDIRQRFDALQSSIGTSRKAYRLGKFLQHVAAARQVTISTGTPRERLLGALALVNAAGEGTYYFLDQFLWLMKAGFVPRHQEAALQRVSAWSEAAGYAANIALSLHKLRQLGIQRQRLAAKLLQQAKDGEPPDAALVAQLQLLHSAAVLRVALIVQDLADSLLALNDITGGRYKRLGHPVVLSLAGLVSAAVSTYKYWGS